MPPEAAAMSRLAICAPSIRLVSSRERELRHQSSDGGADCPCPAPYLGGISGARSGRAEVKMHPVSIGTRHNPTNIAISAGTINPERTNKHRAARVQHALSLPSTPHQQDSRSPAAAAGHTFQACLDDGRS